MGIRLIVEVLDHAPADLTPRERWALVAIAEDARDDTRVCLKGVESNPTLARRMRVGRSERAAIINALIRKGALERVKRGQKHQHAVFRIPPLAPAEEEPDARAPQGEDHRDAEASLRVRETRIQAAAQRPETPEAEDPQGPDSAASGSGNRALSIWEPRTPSPQTPCDPSSLSGDERLVATALADHGVTARETREIIHLIRRENRPRSLPAYLRTLAARGDLVGYLDRVRAEAARRATHWAPPLPEPEPADEPRATPADRAAAIAAARAALAEIRSRARADQGGLVRSSSPRFAAQQAGNGIPAGVVKARSTAPNSVCLGHRPAPRRRGTLARSTRFRATCSMALARSTGGVPPTGRDSVRGARAIGTEPTSGSRRDGPYRGLE